MALHDLWAKQLGYPLYQLWGLNPQHTPQNSFTVAMAENAAHYRARLQAAQAYPLIKLKLGSGSPAGDVELVRLARAELSNRLCVDANGAWSADQACQVIPPLAELGVIFIEQPLAKDDWEGWGKLRRELPQGMPPLIADESVQGVASVPPLAGLVDGINIKLAKCGGLQAARQMIALARAYGMQIMIGCMIETSVAISAAAHLAPLADYADLDGNLLITNDPYHGVEVRQGQLFLPQGSGLGVSPKAVK
jgi:L-alanine-DL-glutamate epimerase-like enolase superfamily enzyme